MSVFGNIMSAIFGRSSSAAAAPTTAPAGAPPTSSAAPAAAPATPTGSPTAPVDVAAIMDNLAAQSPERLDWRKSIVDLMKLVNLDSSLAARKELARSRANPEDWTIPPPRTTCLHNKAIWNFAKNVDRFLTTLSR